MTTRFIFDDTQQENCADIPINPDNILEGTERFFGALQTSAQRVTVIPDQTQIEIIDGQRKSYVIVTQIDQIDAHQSQTSLNTHTFLATKKGINCILHISCHDTKEFSSNAN